MPDAPEHRDAAIEAGDAAYDAVADLYDRAFADITVRRDEWRWLQQHLRHVTKHQRPRVLDIGCGNGALLKQLAPTISDGVGIDVSTRAIDLAQHNTKHMPHLRFVAINSAQLPFDAASFDVVISFLSFRYLDWEAIVPEITRVLTRTGRFLMIDMARESMALVEAPLLLRSAMKHALRPLRDRQFHRDVKTLTSHPAWHAMLAQHPMRRADEYRACMQRHFPGREFVTLNATLSKRVIAFDSGPVRRT